MTQKNKIDLVELSKYEELLKEFNILKQSINVERNKLLIRKDDIMNVILKNPDIEFSDEDKIRMIEIDNGLSMIDRILNPLIEKGE